MQPPADEIKADIRILDCHMKAYGIQLVDGMFHDVCISGDLIRKYEYKNGTWKYVSTSVDWSVDNMTDDESDDPF